MMKAIATSLALGACVLSAASAGAQVADSYMRRAVDQGMAVVAVTNESIVACRASDSGPYQSCFQATYFFQSQPVNGKGTLLRCNVLSAPSSTGPSTIVEEQCSQVL